MTAHPDIWQVILDLAVAPRLTWRRAAQAKDQLQPWVDVETYAHLDANQEHSTIYDWCQDRVSDKEFPMRAVEGILLHALSALRGDARDHALRLLMTMKKTGELPELPPARPEP
jgi:hypothetical protein